MQKAKERRRQLANEVLENVSFGEKQQSWLLSPNDPFFEVY
jgi:hypothetical protein